MSIRLMHYDPRWRQEFQQTRSSLLHSCQGWVTQVEHIGSTAIDGLIARPVIDVLAVVDDGQTDTDSAMQEAALLIEGLNFGRQVPPMWAAETICLVKPRRGLETHRVYLTYPNSPFVSSSLAVREQLQSDRELALQFEEQKVRCWKESEGDVDLYAEKMSPYFSELL
ncbi:MAG: hypothetical protein CBB71_04730 [Rhodopirellula sp. TMED11]|nr:MAG: hypothetical protein CBB71_04730 [Rhodopirellula sp. TMED11]